MPSSPLTDEAVRFGRRRFDTPTQRNTSRTGTAAVDVGSVLDHWTEEVSSRAAWVTIGAFKPVSVRVAEEPV